MRPLEPPNQRRDAFCTPQNELELDYSPLVQREQFGWYSPRLEREMPIMRYGSWGRALLLFPSATADLWDVERHGLVEALSTYVDEGRFSVFCINTINADSWMRRDLEPLERARRQQLYAGYVEHEVVPHIRGVLGNPEARLGVAGASFGAYHAANSFFRRPDQFDTLVAMSGFYQIFPYWLRGQSNDDVYFNNPMWYAPRIGAPHARHLLEYSSINLVAGQGAFEFPNETRRFSAALSAANIAHRMDLWGHDVPHDWPSWQRMLSHYLSSQVGW